MKEFTYECYVAMGGGDEYGRGTHVIARFKNYADAKKAVKGKGFWGADTQL